MKKHTIILYYLFLALGPTIFLFANHSWMCNYDMNPLCYIKCALPAIAGLPILLLKGDDE